MSSFIRKCDYLFIITINFRSLSDFWALQRRTTDILSSDNNPLICAFWFFAGYPGTNWCCMKVWVAEAYPAGAPVMKATQKRDLLLNTGGWALVQTRDRRTVLLEWVHHLLVQPKQVDQVWTKQTVEYIMDLIFSTNRDAEHLNKQICFLTSDKLHPTMEILK